MEAAVIGSRHELQIAECVVSFVLVFVVDFKSSRDWSVGVFPDLDVLEFVQVSPALIPTEHPISALSVAAGLVSTLPLIVRSACLVAIDTFVASVECFSLLPAGATHEAQRFRSFSHGCTS
jgi:hypothetical protein